MAQETVTNSSEKSGRFLLIFFTSFLLLGVLMVSVNYFTDRYRVFHGQELVFHEILEPNTRVLKARYLEQHCSEFDAVIMGSSRDVGYLTSDINRTFGVHAYNYGVAAGNLRGILGRLEWLASMNCLPGRIFLPISIDKLRLPERPNDLLRKEYPAIIGGGDYKREFMLSYIGADAFISNLRKLLRRARKGGDPKFKYDLTTGDVYYLWDRTFEIDGCLAGTDHASDLIIRQYADFLFAIQSLAEDNGAELDLIWNPQPINVQLAYAAEAGDLFQLISKRFDGIYRLPLSDGRLGDSDYYHDKGHFKQVLGAAVIASGENLVPPGTLASELEAAAEICSQP
jgi:hypothetical protein